MWFVWVVMFCVCVTGFSPSSIHPHPHESMCSVCVSAVCVGCMVMQSAQQQVKRREEGEKERGGEKRGGEQSINKNKRTEERESKVREASTKTEKQKKQKSSGAIAPCVAVSEAFNWRRSAASVGNVHTNGITPALVRSRKLSPFGPVQYYRG